MVVFRKYPTFVYASTKCSFTVTFANDALPVTSLFTAMVRLVAGECEPDPGARLWPEAAAQLLEDSGLWEVLQSPCECLPAPSCTAQGDCCKPLTDTSSSASCTANALLLDRRT